MKPQSNKQRVKRHYENQRRRGLVQAREWVHRDDASLVKAFARLLNFNRTGK